MKEYNDFGFSLMDESDLDSNASLVEQIEENRNRAIDYRNRLDRMHKAVLPLLFHLQSNPEKDMIHWPNRAEKINDFLVKLDNIKNGKE